MAQKPFIMDAGIKTGEWSITETENGDLKVSPNTTDSGSQRLFNADAGVKIGDWKFYNEGNYLNLTPNGVSTVGLPTQYDLTDVSAVTKSLEVEFYSNNPTGGYVEVGEMVAANSTHAFFIEGQSGYSEFILSAVNLTTGTTDYTISPDQSSIPDNGIVANDSYVLIATGGGGLLYSTSTQQLVGTIPTHTNHRLFKMTDNYVATMSSNDINQIDVRELDPANNFPLVNSFTGSSSENFGQIGKFDLSDTHIVIGSPYYTSDYQATDYQEPLGKVEVFNIQSGVLEHTFYGRDGIHHTSTASSTSIRFGNGIAIDGDNVAINTLGNNSVAEGFRVYNYKTGELVTVGNRPTWGTNSSKYLNDLGHEAFAASGGLVFLYTGDLRDGSTYNPNQAVFVYNYSGEMVLRIDDPDISTAGQYYNYTYFGKSLAVSGDKLILGARAYSTSTDAGNAQYAIGWWVGKGYIYDLTKTYAEIAQEPTVSDSSQRPFIVDAGIRVGGWSIVQGLNGHLLASTSAEVLLAGELPGPAIGGHLFTLPYEGGYTFTVPSGVTSISAIAVGAGGGGGIGSATGRYGNAGGGGGGGALAYANDIEVSPGDVLYVEIGEAGGTGQPGTNGGDTILKRVNGADNSGDNTYEELLVAGGGAGGTTHISGLQNTGAGGQPSGTELDGGGNGGTGGGRSFQNRNGGGGGGAGGYTGNGGDGKHWGANSTAGTGGAGGGGHAEENSTGLGGGVGLYGEGSSGSAGTSSSVHGGSGSGLQEFSGNSADYAIQYGAGGFGTARKTYLASQGGRGALRIIWGTNRAFPSMDVGESSNTESLN